MLNFVNFPSPPFCSNALYRALHANNFEVESREVVSFGKQQNLVKNMEGSVDFYLPLKITQ